MVSLINQRYGKTPEVLHRRAAELYRGLMRFALRKSPNHQHE